MFLKLLFIGLTLNLFNAFAQSKKLKLGLFTSKTSDCAYIVESQHGESGISVTFTHDPKKFPELSCRNHGFDRYPIGVDIISNKMFRDKRNRNVFQFLTELD